MIEKIAQIEHLQWTEWSKSMTQFLLEIKTLSANPEIQEKIDKKISTWQKTWTDYSQLSEEEKEKDREWAVKILESLN